MVPRAGTRIPEQAWQKYILYDRKLIFHDLIYLPQLHCIAALRLVGY